MGTNYYHVEEPCPHSHNSRKTHIGKSSRGWRFHFQATNTEWSWADWRERLAAGGNIKDEDGKTISFAEFVAIVEDSREEPEDYYNYCIVSAHDPCEHVWRDDDGWPVSEGDFS